MTHTTILAIETSCDETAAAVYDQERGMLSNELFSQIALHTEFGGVIPELASRAHLVKIQMIIERALTKAQVSLAEVGALAVTHKPGLPGSLIIGVCTAKAIAFAHKIPLIGVNHLEGHAYSANIEHTIPFPFLCLTASGGHTSLYLVHDFGVYQPLGETLDDAAGEAFDKVAKLIDLPYPGGPVIEKLAREVGYHDFFQYPRSTPKSLDFSFSGLKTAVLYDLIKKGVYDMAHKKFLAPDDYELKQKIASSLLVCIADIFKQKIKEALFAYPLVQAVAFVGGVACNAYIKQELRHMCQKRGLPFFAPSPQYCTDNAGMIAFVGAYKAQKGEFSDLQLDILT
jgi:N6-L-threonylcarbamoyladenine synthase